MEILTPTEACLESSSDLTISTTEDIDIVRKRNRYMCLLADQSDRKFL